MCDHDAKQVQAEPLAQSVPGAGATRPGSRRRRLWELPRSCHCPVVGVCLPMALLRKLVNKAAGGKSMADDYALHVGAVSECGARNWISEVLQRELDFRHGLVVRRFMLAKSTQELAQLWQLAVDLGDVGGAFWATLTHPRCDDPLQERVVHDIHMIQHQAGAGTRADMDRLDTLLQENGVLSRELAKVQERCTRLMAEKAHENRRLCADLDQARGHASAKDRTIAFLQADLDALKASVPELACRTRLNEKVMETESRLRRQDQQMAVLRQQLVQAHQRADMMPEPVPAAAADQPVVPNGQGSMHLHDKAVLGVGGRTGNVANYRGVVEKLGGRYVHHDGGLEDSMGLLDAHIAAADLVICQTGCISHNAYWRVKDHCKRSGKQCLFVDNPSLSSFTRRVAQIDLHDLTPALVDGVANL